MSEAAKDEAAKSTEDEASEAPRLRSLTIRKFPNVRPTRLVFDDEWNVLLGKNGTGKTTLLELIAATLRGDLRAFEDRDYEIEAELALGPVSVKWTVHSQEPGNGVTEQVPTNLPATIVRSRAAQRRFRAEISCEGLRNFTMTGDQRGVDGHPGLMSMSPTGDPALFSLSLGLWLGNQGVPPEPEPRLVRALLAAAASGDVQRFDEVLTFFQRISPGGDLVASSSGFRQTLISTELGKALQRLMQPTSERISIPHPELHFLRRFVELSEMAGASLHLELIRREGHGESSTAFYGRPSFLFRRANGEEIREQHLSFGQKRLLGFLYYLTVSNPVVADELVDGLHFDWISACVADARGRQKFFASQNPLLVDHMGFKARDSVKSRFIRCTFEGDEMVWSNFSDEEADDFFVAYRTGVQAVSEVLRQKGLW